MYGRRLQKQSAGQNVGAAQDVDAGVQNGDLGEVPLFQCGLDSSRQQASWTWNNIRPRKEGVTQPTPAETSDARKNTTVS